MANGSDKFDAEHTSPPILLVDRTATVQLGVTNTIRYPGDLFERRENVWFRAGAEVAPSAPRGKTQPHPVRDNNHVRFLIDGTTAIEVMGLAMQEANAPGDFIYMLNWWSDPSLTIPGVGKRLGDVLAEAAQSGVQIRGMYWRMGSGLVLNAAVSAIESVFAPWIAPDRRGIDEQNEQMVQLLNTGTAQIQETLYDPSGETVDLPTDPNLRGTRIGAAIHDSRLNKITVTISPPLLPVNLLTVDTTAGSHHQKILCIRAGGKLTAFLGGVDFNRDRIEFVRLTFGGAPLHDVHCELRGPVAGDLLSTFVARWTDHPESAALDATTGPLLATAADLQPPPEPKARHIVQFGRTFGGNQLLTKPGETTSYRFAPAGEQTARGVIRRAIQNARKFIYLEDQYFVSMEASNLLAQVLDANNLAHITIVLPHHEIGDMPFMVKNRRLVIQNLKQKHPDRVRIFYRLPTNGTAGAFHSYVHSKMTIIDDEIAVIGTANYGRRSWTHDSEANMGIYDPSSDEILTSRFAHWLRIRIWAEHLFGTVVPPTPPGQTPQGFDKEFAELHDGVAAGALWQRLIQIKQDFLTANPGKVHQPGQPHPRDNGFDQTSVTSEPLAQTATVRPYDENDDPVEIQSTGLVIAQTILGLSDDQVFNQFSDPSG